MKNSFSWLCITSFVCLLIAIGSSNAVAQKQELRTALQQLINQNKGKIGVAFSILEDNDTLSVNNNRRYVMHSVFKFPVAMAVLHRVDEGKLKLDQKIHITPADLPETYSPLRDKYPNGNVNITLADLLGYMVSQSDNDACDILLKQIGGPPVVEGYIRQQGIRQMDIKVNEQQMATAWQVQYRNWCQPDAMIKLLGQFYAGKLLSQASNQFLWKLMLETTTGAKRIKGLLPAGIQVVHKTGTGPVNAEGLNSATNDVGIIVLPNGRHLAIAVFVNDSDASTPAREKLIAQISKLVYDYAMSR